MHKPALPAISTTDLTVRFGGHVAVNCVTCEFYEGALTAILGPNGAGKTTYFNLLSGQIAPTSGQIYFYGKDITRRAVSHRAKLGLGRAFQLTNLFPKLSTFENVRLAVQARRGFGLDMVSLSRSLSGVSEQADFYLDQVALLPKRTLEVRALSHGDQRKLEIAVLLALEPRVFMFDEPTAGMTIDEVPIIVELIQKIKQIQGRATLLVEHKMDIIKSLANRIVVFHNGQVIADGNPADVMSLQRVQDVYLGKAVV